MENPYGKGFVAVGALSVAHYNYYKKGISVAGVIFVGNEVSSHVLKVKATSVSGHGSRAYITAWTGYYYLYDGLILRLDVERVTRGSCQYWRVIPATTIMPIYDVVVDWNYMMVVKGRDPDFYRSILYSTSIDTVYYRYLVNVPRDTIVYSESSLNVATRVSNPTLASLLFNLLVEAVDLVIIENLVCQGGALCRFFLSMIGGLLNYVNEDLESIAVAFDFNIETNGDVSSAGLRIDKITLKTTNAYSSIGWRPLMVEYRVYIDSDPDPPICDYPYCPYGGGGG
jgi:DNA-binding Lrp family transcriptional regulator